jgi:hypothetical protein
VALSRQLPAMAIFLDVEGMSDRAFKQTFYVDRDVARASATIARDNCRYLSAGSMSTLYPERDTGAVAELNTGD